ncbi:MAG TPA: hypothetical protein VKD66_02880 [Streptosporangiaceae bacterium]|nr:hypothetical protein [Streptosporangiaceae bacterium]
MSSRSGGAGSGRAGGQYRHSCMIPCSPAVAGGNGQLAASGIRRMAWASAAWRPPSGAAELPQGMSGMSAHSVAACSPELYSCGLTGEPL